MLGPLGRPLNTCFIRIIQWWNCLGLNVSKRTDRLKSANLFSNKSKVFAKNDSTVDMHVFMLKAAQTIIFLWSLNCLLKSIFLRSENGKFPSRGKLLDDRSGEYGGMDVKVNERSQFMHFCYCFYWFQRRWCAHAAPTLRKVLSIYQESYISNN